MRHHQRGHDTVSSFALCLVESVIGCEQKALRHPHGSTVPRQGRGDSDTGGDPSIFLRQA
jgi:hypothetical protein